MIQKGLTSVAILLCSNCWSNLILANKFTWLQFYSALFYLMVYQISKVCLSLMYMQHNHMLYGEFFRHHCQVLDQNANYNAYSNPLRHEVWNLDHNMGIVGIYLCYNTFSHLCVQQQHYPEHDTVCLSIFFLWIFFVFSLINDTIFAMFFCQILLELFS